MKNYLYFIILNYNSKQLTIDLVHTLEALISSYTFLSYSTIIVVDNNSDDKEALTVYFENNELHHSILLINTLNSGYAAGNNIGLKYAYEEFSKEKKKDNSIWGGVFILNPDIVIQDVGILDFLVKLLKANKKMAMIGPKVLLPDGTTQGPFRERSGWCLVIKRFGWPVSRIFTKLYRKLSLKICKYRKVYAIVGCFFLSDLEKFYSIDFFDENTFLYYEENILAERYRKYNWYVGYTPFVSVLHNHSYHFNPPQSKYYNESEQYYISCLQETKLLKKLLIYSKKYEKFRINIKRHIISWIKSIFNVKKK